MQYRLITAYKRQKCGRVLATERGAKQHREHCKYDTPVLEGQVEIENFIEEGKTNKKER